MEVYGSWTVAALKIELKKRGAKSTGRKEEYISRLVSYVRNNNFVYNLVADETINDALTSLYRPPDNTFKSVRENSEKSPLDSVNITEYFLKSCESNAGYTMCSLVLRKGYGMMEADFIAAIAEAMENGRFFYKGQVNSEFTKNLSYFSNVTIGEIGQIEEASCECVAGAGIKAQCKHVAATCYAILCFNERGIWPIRKTCTENPQKWHMPKKQKINASPQKAHHLSYYVPIYTVGKKKCGNLNYDPRPYHFRDMPSYADKVRSSVINYRAHNGRRSFGICGLYNCARLSPLIEDHDYLDKPLHHQWIFNLIQASADEAEEIEKRTQNQSLNSEWHHIRACVITASHVGEIVHMTDRRDKNKYAEGLVNPKVFSTPAMTWGKQHERSAVAELEKRSGVKVKPCGLFISKNHPFIGGSPDGLVCVATVLEVKCSYSIRKNSICVESLDYLELQNGQLSLKTSSSYYYQVQTQLLVTGRDFCDFIVWTEKDFKRVFKVLTEIMM